MTRQFGAMYAANGGGLVPKRILGHAAWVEPSLDRITFDPGIMGGRACIRGMRVPVSVVLAYLADGASEEEVLADYPALEPEDIRQALAYAAWLASEDVYSTTA